MATDIMTLGGLVFDDWTTPAKAPSGGKHMIVPHKLPGGARVVDTLGPDEMDIPFSGVLWGDEAEGIALALNGLRIAGTPVPLTYAGNFFQVIVQDCKIEWQRYPNYATWSISCFVVSNPMAGANGSLSGALGSLSGAVGNFSSLVSADMSSALSLVGF